MADPVPLQMELVTSPDVGLKFKSMSAHEEVSRLFEFQVIAISGDSAISADDLLGTQAAVSLEVADDTKRWFHGVIASFGIEGVVGRYYSYRLTLRPWAWLLTRSADLRIFQQKTAPDIIKDVFGEYAHTFVNELKGTYATRTYCVQYRETDFNFVSRLMEEEGIFYYWRHSEDKHELVLADGPSTHVATPGFDTILYLEDDLRVAEKQAINDWHMRHEIQPGKATLSDYDFDKPSTSLRSLTASGSRKHAEREHEIYDYPGLYGVKADGDARARIRLDELSARFGRFTGQGNTPGLAAGALFTLKDHPRADQNGDYVLLSTQIDMQQAGYESGNEQDTLFLCRFVAKAAADPFRPARTTRKPSVAGPQTALVVGDGDKGDIWTDKYGRVKVQFHWDRVGKKDGKSSCWLRVASGWAGNGWGLLAIPRIGQEVVVAFLEGDPDQPLVVGSVYNAENMPPYELPAKAAVMTLKSRTLQGAVADYNELRFDDTKGSEHLMLQAQKDRYDIVKNDLRTDVANDEERSVGKNQSVSVGENLALTVGKAMSQTVGDALHLDVAKDQLVNIGANHGLKVTQDASTDAGQNWSLNAGQDIHAKAGMNLGAEAGMNLHLKGGMNVVIEAGMQLTIKAGPASVVLGPDGVSITGPLVKVNSGGAAGSGSGAKPKKPAKPEKAKKPEKLKDPLDGKHR
jgi:type VI secretion system secreted protein VgrG